MKEQVSPRQVGRALGVSEASIKRWCDKGRFETFRTAGGHRRLAVRSVLEYVRESGHELVRPELLGLPSSTGRGERLLSKVRPVLQDALASGDEEQFRRMAFNLYLGGQSCCEIFDRCVADTFRQLGELWQHGDLEVYQERRAVGMCTRLLHEFRLSIPPVPQDAPLALGGTLSGDAYTLATTMAEIVLRENGWNAQSFGVGLPAETLCAAIERERPRLVWLSVSHLESEAAFLESYGRLYDTAQTRGVAVAVGGNALDEDLRRKIRYSTYCEQLHHLVEFAGSLQAPAAGPSRP